MSLSCKNNKNLLHFAFITPETSSLSHLLPSFLFFSRWEGRNCYCWGFSATYPLALALSVNANNFYVNHFTFYLIMMRIFDFQNKWCHFFVILCMCLQKNLMKTQERRVTKRDFEVCTRRTHDKISPFIICRVVCVCPALNHNRRRFH